MKYKAIIVDAQLVLTRSFSITKNYRTWTEYDVVRNFFYSISSMLRDHHGPVERVILCWDKRPYHKDNLLGGTYKGSRSYITEDDSNTELVITDQDVKDIEYYLDQKEKPERPQEFLDLVKEYEVRKVLEENRKKGLAKYYILKNFHDYGMISIIKDGWEADDIAYICANICEEINYNSAVYTVDGDWEFFTNPVVDYIHINTQKPKTFEVVKTKVPKGLDLHPREFNIYVESLIGNHNDLVKTITKESNKLSWDKLILDIQSNGIDKHVTDIDLYHRQVSTFRLETFPEYNELVNECRNALSCSVNLITAEQYQIKHQYQGFKVLSSYYENHLNGFKLI